MLEQLEAAEEQLDEEIDRLDKMGEDELEVVRRKRLESMKAAAKQKEKWRAQGHGEYRELTEEKEFFKEIKEAPRAVVHFYRPSTWRCEIIDKHLRELSAKHVETKFVRVNAEKVPFLVERLKIWMLPTVVLVKAGKTHHSIVGFDELGGDDEFTTEQLEDVLVAHGVIHE